MNASPTIEWFCIGALAVWRVTHLLAHEDGPGLMFARVRAAAEGRFWAGVVTCFYCLSLWVAAPVAAWLGGTDLRQGIVLWLALSGAACLLERWLPVNVRPAVFYEGDKEETHELLRRSAHGDDARPQ